MAGIGLLVCGSQDAVHVLLVHESYLGRDQVGLELTVARLVDALAFPGLGRSQVAQLRGAVGGSHFQNKIMVEGKPLVTITGVTGYVGGQVLNEFLCGEGKGQFRIRATVRDKANEGKMKPLKDYFGAALDEVEFVEATLEDVASLERAVDGATYVVHTAAHVDSKEPKDHQEWIKPAVSAVRAIMESSKKGGVKRVVFTSSVAAMVNCEREK